VRVLERTGYENGVAPRHPPAVGRCWARRCGRQGEVAVNRRFVWRLLLAWQMPEAGHATEMVECCQASSRNHNHVSTAIRVPVRPVAVRAVEGGACGVVKCPSVLNGVTMSSFTMGEPGEKNGAWWGHVLRRAIETPYQIFRL